MDWVPTRHHCRASPSSHRRCGGFTLVELLVVISIMAALIGLLMPSLARARKQAKGTLCLTRLRTLGQGLTMYALDNGDVFVPGRLPKVSDQHWQEEIAGGLKYRPTFLAMMGSNVGIPPFDDPQPTKITWDRFGEKGDRQNYSNDTYVCPAVPTWRDERNGCYGYNYQFLGNSRLFDSHDLESFKNWPVQYTRVRSPSACVAVADSMGTAAYWREEERLPYQDSPPYMEDPRDAEAFGNEGFNLDPPRVDPANGEMANFDKSPQSRCALHARHVGRGNVLWVDGHCSPETLEGLGYQVLDGGAISYYGNNRFFTPDGSDRAWSPHWQTNGNGS